jgi:hypothetical protein
VDPDAHVLQIDLIPTNASASPKPVHAFLISLILNNSKIVRHNNTTMTQHTSPVLYFHIDAIQRKRKLVYLIHSTYTSSKVQASLPTSSPEKV